MKDTYKKLYGKVPEIKAIHAGLECGIIMGPYPKLDAISFGPTIRYPAQSGREGGDRDGWQILEFPGSDPEKRSEEVISLRAVIIRLIRDASTGRLFYVCRF